jgi:hypothetical protein
LSGTVISLWGRLWDTPFGVCCARASRAMVAYSGDQRSKPSMCSVKLFSTTVALAIPAIMWPPRPVRAEVLVQPTALVTQADAADLR